MYVFFLEMAESQDAAGEYGPQLFFCKLPLLYDSFIDLIFKCPLWKLPQRIDFIKAHAKLFIFRRDNFLQRDDMSIIFKLFNSLVEYFCDLFERLQIGAVDLPKEILLLR
jgi:hypothetical protein